MSDEPRVGTYLHGEVFPNKLAVYNCDFAYWHDGRISHMPEPWAVDRGNQGLDSFHTYEEALDFVRGYLANRKQAA